MALARIYRAGLTGTAAAAVARIYRAGLTGTSGISLNALPNHLLTEPGTLITLTASVAAGGPATSYTWRIVSQTGGVVLTESGGSVCTLYSPSRMPPNNGSVVVGVVANKSGATSPEQFSTITALPQLQWTRKPGGQWVGATRYPPPT